MADNNYSDRLHAAIPGGAHGHPAMNTHTIGSINNGNNLTPRFARGSGCATATGMMRPEFPWHIVQL